MKKLGKFNLKAVQKLKQEELINIKGGSGGTGATCNCTVFYGSDSVSVNGVTGYSSCGDAAVALLNYYGGAGATQVNCYAA